MRRQQQHGLDGPKLTRSHPCPTPPAPYLCAPPSPLPPALPGIIMWELFTGSAAFERQHYGEVFEVRASGSQAGLSRRAAGARHAMPCQAQSWRRALQPGSGAGVRGQGPGVIASSPPACSPPCRPPCPSRATPPSRPPLQRVVLRNERPPIPAGIPAPYQLLMTRCWQSDPMQRPGFDTVLRLINLMIEELLEEGSDGVAGPGDGGEGGSGGGVGGAPPSRAPAAAGARASGDGRGAAAQRRGSGVSSPGSNMIQDL
jgi:hypothetical protein